MTRDDVRRYLDETRAVEGWFFPVDAYLFAFADDVQKRERLRGNLFEIGVHHGKTALFLARMKQPDELLGVCDVFDQQELNRDHSGEGNRAIFERNMQGFDVRIFAKESALLTSTDTTTRCRFVHIDGGHRPEDVMGDLFTAERALLPDGIVALDDVFNPNWPGVSEGFYRYMSTRPDALAPILIGGNKVLFARRDAASNYDALFSAVAEHVDAPFAFERKEWLGQRVLTAIRLAWVDLDPMGAARLHER